MPNVIDVLKQDHRQVAELFSDFERTRASTVVEQICANLEVHAAAEELFVYPALREDVSSGSELAAQAEHEHAEAKRLIGRLKRTTTSERVSDMVAELKQTFERHVAEEEGTVFPKMQSDLKDTEMYAIGANVEEFEP
jgi:iron-sulfur cluster repair protein YtfE (RIC family)